MAENFLKLTEDIRPQIQEVLWTLGRIKSKKTTFMPIIIKLERQRQDTEIREKRHSVQRSKNKTDN